jgi:IS30 family transposase
MEAVVRLETVPQYVKMGPTIKEMADNGASINSMAGATGLCWRAVADILEYVRTGKLPDSKNRPTKASRSRGADRPSNPPYAKHSARIVELRREKLSFQQIADRITAETGETISMSTARRGFEYAQREQIAEKLKAGQRPNRGHSRQLSAEKVGRIHQLLQTSASVSAIAKEVGCGSSSVYRERALLMQQPNAGADS